MSADTIQNNGKAASDILTRSAEELRCTTHIQAEADGWLLLIKDLEMHFDLITFNNRISNDQKRFTIRG